MSVNGIAFQELSEEILGRGALLRFQARGDSMRPFIEWGDTIIIEPLNDSQFNIGDVLFCRRIDGRLLAHRLIRIDIIEGKNYLILKGDNVPRYDFPIPVDDVLGKVVRVESQGMQLNINGKWHRILGRSIAWFSGKSCNPVLTWITRNLGRLYWFKG